MRGLRSFAAQATAAYGKLGATLKQLIPVINAAGSSFARMGQTVKQLASDTNAAAAGFGRIRLAMASCIPVAAILTRSFGNMATAAQFAAVSSQSSFASLAAAAGKASLAGGGAAAGFSALLAPLAGIAAVAGTAYVALFKWNEIPGILKPILLVASPLVFTIRAMATAWSVATAPVRLFAATLRTATGAITATAKAIPRLAVGVVTTFTSMTAAAVRFGAKLAASVARGVAAAGASVIAFGRGAVGALSKLGEVVGGIGADVGRLAGVVVDPLRRAGDEFARAGTAALALATAAGVSVTSMTALGYAAERAGSSGEAVAAAMQRVNESLAEVQAGTDAGDIFRQLGLDIAQLTAMSPEKRFEELGLAIASLADPLERAAAAQAVFGAGNEKLVDMFGKGRAGLEQMRKEAERLGLVMSGPQAAAAKAMADAYKLVQDATTGLWRTLGAAVAPQLTATAKATADVIQAVTAWVSKNGALIAQAFKVASTVAGVATALTTVGSALALATPGIIALAAALGAGYLAWGRFGDNATKALGAVQGTLRAIQAETTAVMGGIWDAIQGGDLEAAVGIAWLGAQKAWVEGLRAVASITNETLGGILNALAAGDWRNAAGQAWNALQGVFEQGVGMLDQLFVGLMDTVDNVVTYIRQQVNVAISQLAKLASAAITQAVELSKAFEKYDPSGLLMSKRLDMQIMAQPITSAANRDPAVGNAALAADAAARAAARAADLAGRQQGRDARLAGLNAQAGADAAAAGNAAGARGLDIDARLTAALDRARLARMMAQQGDAADIERRNRLAKAAQAAAAAPQTAAFGATFSAAALVAQNGGSNVQRDIAKATQATAAGVRQLVEADKKRKQQTLALALVPVA